MDGSSPGPPAHPQTDEAGRRALETLREALGSDFEILRPLGQGSVASVYLARDRALGVLSAIKVLNPGKAADETTRRRFEREARAAASLGDDPNIVGVTRFGRLPDETPYVVMQYVKGRTLDERLKAEAHLSVEEGRQTLRQVASALARAHEKGILHRDVRPGNVLWDEENRRALLTDFGIAAILTGGGMEGTRLTETGQLLGDPRYLSPEQLRDEDLTELADMYLFGVMGYEILTGKPPYNANTTAGWINAHLLGEPRSLETLRPGVPGYLADLLWRCLAKEPKHRPTARDVVRVLESGGAGDAGPASVPAAGGDIQALIQRRVPQIVLLTAGAGITLIGLADALEGLLPEDAMILTVVFVVAAIVASAVIAWFHGEKGKQQAPAIEYVLLALVAMGWLAVSAMAVLR